eukprot:jgi/Picre1/28719/NNA_004119.t1
MLEGSRCSDGAWASRIALLFYLLILLSISGVCVGDTAAELDDGQGAMEDVHVYSRRRLEQRSGAIRKDTCKFDVAYTISSITRSKFDATIIVENNREVSSPLQLVYRYPDADRVDLEFVTGGVLVSKSNGTLVPIRIKTIDSVSSNQDVDIGSSVKFINLNGGNGPSPYTSLAIQDLNVNGVQCEALRGKTLAGGARARACCGEYHCIRRRYWKVVSDDTKEQQDAAAGAEEEQKVSEEDKKPNQEEDKEQQASDIPPAEPASTLNEQKDTTGSQESSDGGSGNSTALMVQLLELLWPLQPLWSSHSLLSEHEEIEEFGIKINQIQVEVDQEDPKSRGTNSH